MTSIVKGFTKVTKVPYFVHKETNNPYQEVVDKILRVADKESDKLAKKINQGKRLNNFEARKLVTLQEMLNLTRSFIVLVNAKCNVPNKDIAEALNLTAGRISQIVNNESIDLLTVVTDLRSLLEKLK